MAIATLAARNTMATNYGTLAKYGALFTADPGTSGTVVGEVTGGTPAYSRISCGWGAAASSAITSAAMAFNVPGGGTTVAWFGACTSATAGTADLQDRVSITSQQFNSQGTYTITATYTQS